MSQPDPQDNSPDYRSDPDAVLMLDFQSGNKASFETLMRKYYTRIFNFVYRFVFDRALAEDLTQDVFLRVYKNVATYQPQAKFQTWIYTIAKNAALNELRRAKRKGFSLDAAFATKDGTLMPQVEDPRAVQVDKKLQQEEKQQLVREAIDSLPENQRLAVILRRYDDFSYEEIAKTLNCTVPAVKSLLSRAKETLRQKLADAL